MVSRNSQDSTDIIVGSGFLVVQSIASAKVTAQSGIQAFLPHQGSCLSRENFGNS
ncbi:MAG: hypothetical protein V7K18_25250 [Nostoc sp.]|uniref:hypothetical protein n=1 Tax=Nostoc sp. TaxID=1180 RepID=UPI002FF59F15